MGSKFVLHDDELCSPSKQPLSVFEVEHQPQRKGRWQVQRPTVDVFTGVDKVVTVASFAIQLVNGQHGLQHAS